MVTNTNKQEAAVTALIPARGGSKSIPNKNIKQIDGKPLVAWPIKTASKVPIIDEIYVTTDDEEIADVAGDYGAEVIKRPKEYAEDDSLVIDAIRHALGELSEKKNYPDQMVLLEPTCPFRGSNDIKASIETLDKGYDSVATFVEAEINPHRVWHLKENKPTTFIPDANPWLPRQELPDAFQLNGGCYAFRTDVVTPSSGPGLLFGESAGVEMPPERSIDIDSPIDLRVARAMVAEGLVDVP